MRNGQQLLKGASKEARAGFTLVEAVISIGLLGVFGLLAASTSRLLEFSKRISSISRTRDQLLALTRQTASNYDSLHVSLQKPGNEGFRACVCGGGLCTSGREAPLLLFDSNGIQQTPAYFDPSGLPCDPASPNCILEVSTAFMAECMPQLPNANPTPPYTCSNPAEFVEIIYTIQQNPASLAAGHFIKPFSGGAFIQTADLAPAGSGWCP